MKRILLAVAVGIACLPIRADAHCGVACYRSNVVAVPYAVAVGVPVAEYAPVNYSYVNPQPPANITVNVSNAPIDTAALATAIQSGIVQGLSGPPQPSPTPVPQNVPPAPAQPPAQTPTPPITPPQPAPKAALSGPALFQEASCVRCHAGGNSAATSALDMRAAMTDTQRKVAARDVIEGKMPKGAAGFGPEPSRENLAGTAAIAPTNQWTMKIPLLALLALVLLGAGFSAYRVVKIIRFLQPVLKKTRILTMALTEAQLSQLNTLLSAVQTAVAQETTDDAAVDASQAVFNAAQTDLQTKQATAAKDDAATATAMQAVVAFAQSPTP